MAHITTKNSFSLAERKLYQRLIVAQIFVAECSITDHPCQLLASELDELIVFTDKLSQLAGKLRKALEPTHG